MSHSHEIPTPKEQFLQAYAEEHVRTLKVLRAFPAEKSDLRPHPKLKSARELAWMFTLERGLGTAVMNNAFAHGAPRSAAARAGVLARGAGGL